MLCDATKYITLAARYPGEHPVRAQVQKWYQCLPSMVEALWHNDLVHAC